MSRESATDSIESGITVPITVPTTAEEAAIYNNIVKECNEQADIIIETKQADIKELFAKNIVISLKRARIILTSRIRETREELADYYASLGASTSTASCTHADLLVRLKALIEKRKRIAIMYTLLTSRYV